VIERPRVRTGIAFALALELFQLGFYPGWLDPASYGEFASLTAFGHLVYGLMIAITAKTLLDRFEPHPTEFPGSSVGGGPNPVIAGSTDHDREETRHG